MDQRPIAESDLKLAVRPPAQFMDVVTWAAWLYYVDELTQAEVAQQLRVSRASVANYLQEARRTGVVTIRIDSGTVSRTEIAEALSRRFSLSAATVLPNLDDRQLEKRLGKAAAKILSDSVVPGDTIGVAWGRTVLEAARQAESSLVPDLTIVQVSGSSNSSADFSPELCTSLLANQLGARCVNLHAPAVLSSRDLRDRLLAEPSLVRQFALIRSATKILFGVGELGPHSTFADAGMLDEAILSRLRDEGHATGVIIGRLIGPSGEPIASPVDDGIVGISLENLKHIPFRLCLAGGPQKVEAIVAALKGGYATHFVTDHDTAVAILDKT